MENNEIKIIRSERGEDLVLLDNNKYRFIRKRKDTRLKWKCSNNKCIASILTESEKKVLIQRLGKHYNSDDALGNWLKMFFGLQFINHDEVEDAFVELIAVCPNQEIGHIFSDYVLNNYTDPGCPFNTKLWAMEPSEIPGKFQIN